MERVGKIQTLTGLVDPADLGFTHSHEHVLWDYFKMIKSYDVIFEDEDVACNEVQWYKDAGGGTLIDCSSSGIGTQPDALRRISENTGVNIVLGCGWYRESVYEDAVFKQTSNQLAQRMIKEIQVGFGISDMKAGFIGEIGTERGCITPAEERVFLAAAKASLATGVAIFTHTTHFGELALEQIELLENAGISPDRILISHLGDREDSRGLLKIAERGVYMSIDNIGYIGDGYPSDDVRLNNVKTLLDNRYEDRLVLGSDIGSRSALKTYGGRGFTWLLENFIPRLIQSGLSQDEIELITSSNISRAMTIQQV
jgi:predicted metal-dependent phosphotriesterase family hydrolase